MKKTVSAVLKPFFTSLFQCALFSLFYITYRIWNVLKSNNFGVKTQSDYEIAASYVRPILIISLIFVALFHVIFNMKRLDIHVSKLVSKASLLRLLGRVLAVLSFLVIGYYMQFFQLKTIPEWFTPYIIVSINEFKVFPFYWVVSIFPSVFALLEYLFVKPKNA